MTKSETAPRPCSPRWTYSSAKVIGECPTLPPPHGVPEVPVHDRQADPEGTARPFDLRRVSRDLSRAVYPPIPEPSGMAVFRSFVQGAITARPRDMETALWAVRRVLRDMSPHTPTSGTSVEADCHCCATGPLAGRATYHGNPAQPIDAFHALPTIPFHQTTPFIGTRKSGWSSLWKPVSVLYNQTHVLIATVWHQDGTRGPGGDA